MGFNPHQKHRTSPADIALIAAAIAICIAGLLWAILA